MMPIATKDLGAAPPHFLAGYDPSAMTRAIGRYYGVRDPEQPAPAGLETLVELARKQLDQLQRILSTVGPTPPAE